MRFASLITGVGQTLQRASHSVAARLVLGFGGLAALMVLLMASAFWHTRAMSREFVGVLDQRVPCLALLQDVLSDVNELNLAARDALLATDPAVVNAQLARIQRGRSTIGDRIDKLRSKLQRSGDPRDAALADQVSGSSSGILIALVKFSRTLQAGSPDDRDAAAKVLNVMLQPKLTALSELVTQYQQEQVKSLAAAKDQALQVETSARLQFTAILLAALAVGTIAAFLITRSIAMPLRHAVAIGDALSQGDLAARVEHYGNDEAGRVLASFNRIAERLGKMVIDIREGAEQVSGAARDIADGNADLSRRTDEQARALASTTGLLHELETHVDNNAQSARRADERAGEAAQLAESGGSAMDQVVESMHGIAASARKINDITAVIDDLAFQTNILALNAAVEAARAGDQGRGFAVVASEVRSLAQRSATAAKEIKKLIQDSVEQVRDGTRRVDLVSGRMTDVVTSAREVSELIRHISAASAEQRDGIRRMGAAIGEVDDGGTRNAALVEHVASTSQNLRQMADDLRRRVSIFHL